MPRNGARGLIPGVERRGCLCARFRPEPSLEALQRCAGRVRFPAHRAPPFPRLVVALRPPLGAVRTGPPDALRTCIAPRIESVLRPALPGTRTGSPRSASRPPSRLRVLTSRNPPPGGLCQPGRPARDTATESRPKQMRGKGTGAGRGERGVLVISPEITVLRHLFCFLPIQLSGLSFLDFPFEIKVFRPHRTSRPSGHPLNPAGTPRDSLRRSYTYITYSVERCAPQLYTVIFSTVYSYPVNCIQLSLAATPPARQL